MSNTAVEWLKYLGLLTPILTGFVGGSLWLGGLDTRVGALEVAVKDNRIEIKAARTEIRTEIKAIHLILTEIRIDIAKLSPAKLAVRPNTPSPTN